SASLHWTEFKLWLCGFAAQKYSTKPQLNFCRLPRRYAVMANMSIEKITIACSNFRYALEKCHSLLGRSFENFPSGACGDTTPLLGTYLIEQGFETFMYASGNKGNTTHAWLQLNSIVIDITADQFPE